MGQKLKKDKKMKRFNELKRMYPDAILLMRDARYYNTYGEDARKVAEVTGKKIRNNMCHFKRSELNWVLPKLIRAGNRIAIEDEN